MGIFKRKNADAYFKMGGAYLKREQYTDAMAAFEKGIALGLSGDSAKIARIGIGVCQNFLKK